FYPGMYVKVALSTGERESITVPNAALLQRAELRAVYVVSEDKVQLRQVLLGKAVEQHTEILSGLAPDETIALDPLAAASYLVAQRKGDNQ
ncbi:MAG: efflux transporter periplasmic adaptor subunit, partial [Granulosicoccaceae bacterium]